MEAIVVHGTNKKDTRFIIELVKKLGGSVSGLSKEQVEDILMGKWMDHVKTGEEVSKTSILKKLA